MSKTKFAGDKNPFTGKELTLEERLGVEITSDPLPTKRLVEGAYDQLYRKLSVGQSIKCDSKRVNAMANGLRSWIDKNNKREVWGVKACTNYGDGFGRVWLVAKEQ